MEGKQRVVSGQLESEAQIGPSAKANRRGESKGAGVAVVVCGAGSVFRQQGPWCGSSGRVGAVQKRRMGVRVGEREERGGGAMVDRATAGFASRQRGCSRRNSRQAGRQVGGEGGR